MKNLLIVDDDKSFLLSLKDGLLSHNKKYSVSTAFNGKEAVTILNAIDIDLVITDLKMPVMDGFELLAHMSKRHNNIPVIVITAFGTEKIEQQINEIGLFQYLEKPLDFNVLTDKINECLEKKSEGFIKGITLSSILQLIEMERKTCSLMINSEKKRGEVFFENGILLFAETGQLIGDEAAYNMVVWDQPEIEISEKKGKEKNITQTLKYILLEAYRILDEKKEEQKKSKNNMEDGMNVEKLENAITGLRRDLGSGLLATDFFVVADGQTLAGFNSNPQACALFTQLTLQMNETLGGSGFPIIGKYYILDLADNKMVIVIPLGDYMCGMLLDKTSAKLGLVLNIGIPRVIDAFEEALVS